MNNVIRKKTSIIRLTIAIVLAGISLTAQAGKITAIPSPATGANGFGGWNLGNVEIILNGTGSTFDEATGAYSFAADSDFTYQGNVDDGAGTIMGHALAKDWPVGEPSGIKVVNDDFDVKLGKPTNCVMSTSYLADHFLDSADPAQVLCSGPFQSHKRYKLAMLPTTVDGGIEGVDMVFNVEAEAGSRDYQIFQKINNWTDGRLQGFTIQVGFGTGASFTPASAVIGAGVANLSLSVPDAVWNAKQLANFSSGLFGPIDLAHGRPAGYFDPIDPAGFFINEFPNVSGTTDTLTATTTLGSDYADLPAGAGLAANQFGPWLPSNMLPFGIFFDDDGNPDTDAELQAWYGYNPSISALGWMTGAADGFAVVSDAEILAKGENLLMTMGVIDDLVNVGLNYIVTIGDVSTFPGTTFTIRITPTADTSGTAQPTYVGAVPVATPVFPFADAVVALDPSPAFTVGSLLTARVGDADLNTNPLVAEEVIIAISSSTGLSDNLTLVELGEDRGVFAAPLPDTYSNVVAGTVVTMTYNEADDGTVIGVPTPAVKTATSTASTDAGLIQFNPALYTPTEGDGTVVLTVARIGGSTGEVTVEYNTVSGTAIGNDDYTPVTGTLTFADTITSQPITVTLLDDALNEPTESFNVILSNVLGGAALDSAASNAQVDIADDDALTVQFSSATYSAAENAGSVTLTVERNSTVGILDVDYASADISATDGADYTAVTGTVNFLDGEGSKTIVVTLLDDMIFEGDESLSVTLSNASVGALGAIPSTQVVITENDAVPTVQFNSATYSVTENVGSVTLTVDRSSAVGALTVDYASADVSATGGADYTAVTGTLNFIDGESSKTIVVTILDDTIVEGDESFSATLSNASVGVLGAIPSTQIVITENDVAASDDDNGLFGLGLSWITAGLLGLGLLLRRKRF